MLCLSPHDLTLFNAQHNCEGYTCVELTWKAVMRNVIFDALYRNVDEMTSVATALEPGFSSEQLLQVRGCAGEALWSQ